MWEPLIALSRCLVARGRLVCLSDPLRFATLNAMVFVLRGLFFVFDYWLALLSLMRGSLSSRILGVRTLGEHVLWLFSASRHILLVWESYHPLRIWLVETRGKELSWFQYLSLLKRCAASDVSSSFQLCVFFGGYFWFWLATHWSDAAQLGIVVSFVWWCITFRVSLAHFLFVYRWCIS